MILLFAFVLSVGVALLRGGKLERLAGIGLRHGWLAIGAFALQIIDIYFPLPASEGLLSWRVLLLVGSYGLLLVFVGLNRHLPGVPLIGAGLALNLLVMLGNGGYMPITPEALGRAGLDHLALGSKPGSRLVATKDILLPREETRLWILSDILVIPSTLPLSSAFSAGDVVLAVGVFWFFQQAMASKAATASRAVAA